VRLPQNKWLSLMEECCLDSKMKDVKKGGTGHFFEGIGWMHCLPFIEIVWFVIFSLVGGST